MEWAAGASGGRCPQGHGRLGFGAVFLLALWAVHAGKCRHEIRRPTHPPGIEARLTPGDSPLSRSLPTRSRAALGPTVDPLPVSSLSRRALRRWPDESEHGKDKGGWERWDKYRREIFFGRLRHGRRGHGPGRGPGLAWPVRAGKPKLDTALALLLLQGMTIGGRLRSLPSSEHHPRLGSACHHRSATAA